MKRTPFVYLLALTGALAACKDAGDDAPPSSSKLPPKNTTSFSNVAVNPKATWTTAKQRDSVQIEENRLIFPASGNDALLKKKAGDILVSDRSAKGNNPDGFMRKVVSVTKAGGSIEMTTEPAYLNEVLIGQFEVVADSADLRAMTAEELGASAAGYDLPGLAPQAEVSASFDLGKDVKDLKLFDFKVGAMDIPVSDGQVGVSIGGSVKVNEASFHFKPSIRVGGEIDVPGGFWDKFNPVNYVQEFHVIAKGQVDSKMVIGGSGAISVEAVPEKYKKEMKDFAAKVNDRIKQLNPPSALNLPILKLPFIGPPLPTPVGPIPITYEFSMELVCTAALAGGVEADFGYSGSAVAEFGTIYEQGKGWSPVNSFDFQITKIGPNWKANGSAEIKCALEPKLATKVAGFAGPFIKISGSLGIKGEYKEECPENGAEGRPKPSLGASIDAGFGVSLGAEAKFNILSKEIKLGEASFSLYDKSWNIWKTDPYLDLPESWALGYCAGEEVVGQGGAAGAGGSSAGAGGSDAGSGGSNSAGSSAGGSSSGGSSSGGSDAGGSSAGGSSAGSSSGGSSSGGSSGAGGSSSNTCGNGKIDAAVEFCDGNDFGGKTCASVTGSPQATGNLTCSAQCTISTDSCDLGASCGDVCTDTDKPQKAECGSCQQSVCAANPYCCEIAWDLVCVEAAKTQCGQCN